MALFESLKPKSVKPWADYSDDEEETVGKMSLSDLAALVCKGVEDTETNISESSAHHFKVGKMNVDIMLGRTITINITRDREVSTSSEEEETETEAAEEVAKDKAEDDEWKVVTRHKGGKAKKTYQVFRDSANDPHFGDIVATVTELSEAKLLASRELWAHIYCVEENMVYDFPDPNDRSKNRSFTPNEYYVEKYDQWAQHPEPDKNVWYLFGEGPEPEYDWPASFIGKFNSMNEARAKAKTLKGWSHVYSPALQEVVTFSISKHNTFKRTISKATDEYMQRWILQSF